jgi:hypothetical protein
MTNLIDVRLTNESLAMEWWYEVGRHKDGNGICAKDFFLSDRLSWEDLQQYIFRHNQDHPSHEDCKNLIRRLDKEGLAACNSLDDAVKTQQQRKENQREWGTARGTDGLISLVENMHAATSRKLSRGYIEYISSSKWKRRAGEYLDQCCIVDGFYICEMCGRKHKKRETINVHHNTYDGIWKGQEVDAHLMSCCRGMCHNLADIARRIQCGTVDAASVNDAMRPLFNL